jgi:hypothetical protein
MTYSVISSVRQRVNRILRQQRCRFINQNPAAAVTRREGANDRPALAALASHALAPRPAHDTLQISDSPAAFPESWRGLSGGGEASVPRPKEAVANFYAGARTTLWRRKLRCEI